MIKALLTMDISDKTHDIFFPDNDISFMKCFHNIKRIVTPHAYNLLHLLLFYFHLEF